MTVTINGERRDVAAATVTGLVTELGLEPRAVLVERNGDVVMRHEWDGCAMQEGDRVEIMRVAAGG